MLLDSLKIRKDPEPLSDLPSLEIWNYKKYQEYTQKNTQKDSKYNTHITIFKK